MRNEFINTLCAIIPDGEEGCGEGSVEERVAFRVPETHQRRYIYIYIYIHTCIDIYIYICIDIYAGIDHLQSNVINTFYEVRSSGT